MKRKRSKKKKDSVKFDHIYKEPRDYTNLFKLVKYTVITMVILIFALAAYKTIKSDTTEEDELRAEVIEFINKVDFTKEESLRVFAESFTDLYLSSETEGKERKELMSRYIASYGDFQVKHGEGVSFKVKSTKLIGASEVIDDLYNASVFARVEVTRRVIDEESEKVTTETIIKDYILKLPIKVTKADDGEFLYLIYKAPSFEPLPLAGDEYQGKFIKLTQLSPIKTSAIEETVKSFIKVYLEGTNSEIEYFYKGDKLVKGFKGDMELVSISTKVYEMKGDDDLVAYSIIEVSDGYAVYKNSYEFKLTENEDKWYIKSFDLKESGITTFENEEE